MLDENIENLSPDEHNDDIDSTIEKSEEKKPPNDKKSEKKELPQDEVANGESPEKADHSVNSNELSLGKPETVEEISVEDGESEVVEEVDVEEKAVEQSSVTIEEGEVQVKKDEKPEVVKEVDVEEKAAEQGSKTIEEGEVQIKKDEKSEVAKEVDVEEKAAEQGSKTIEAGEVQAKKDEKSEVVKAVDAEEKAVEQSSETIEEGDIQAKEDEKSGLVKAVDAKEKAVEQSFGSIEEGEVHAKKDEGSIKVEEDESKNESDEAEPGETVKDTEGSAPSKESITPKDKAAKEVPTIDYTKLDLDEIVVFMQQLVDEFTINKIKAQFEVLRSNFDKKYKGFIADKKKEFIKDGGNEIDFKFYLPVKNMFNDVLYEFKKKRQKYYKDIEVEQKLNHERKLQLINDLKELIDTAEPSTMYKNFRSLQDEWRTIGQIPHTKYNDVWRTYHHHVERFYDLLHLNNDFRDLDFKHNLEEKTKLIEKVEKLGDDPDVNRAFKELQIIHRMWKEDIGPVGRDVREEVWNRFSEATKKIHNKRHEFQNELESKFKENVGLKLAIIDKIKAIKTEGYNSHKLWQNAIREMEDLRKEFFAIGRVPRSKNEEVWQIFKDATRNFNKAKNVFYKSIKKDQSDNLARKMQLIEQAESLKDSEDWEMVTEVFKKIQADWKTIGHVPRRDSDKIWKKFKEACNYYFDRLHNMQDGHSKGQTLIFNKKKELLEKFKADIESEDKLDLDLINKYISEWRELGVVPVNMRHIEAKLNKIIDAACKKLNISREETALLKFKNVIDAYFDQKDFRKLDNEQLFIKRKVDDLTKEIKQLENNISFISNATDDNPLVKNVYKNIEKYGEDLKIWERKLAYIRHLEY